MRKSSTRAAVVIGGTLAGVSSTFAFGAQAALFPSEQTNSALDGLVANPSQSAPVNSGSATPTPSNSEKAEKKQEKENSTPSPKPTKQLRKIRTLQTTAAARQHHRPPKPHQLKVAQLMAHTVVQVRKL